jgi:hypothetical protein
MRHVAEVTDRLVTDGVLSGRERGAIVRTAARSDIGKPAASSRMSWSMS